MSKSYRIRTKLGTDQNIRVNVEQDFDFLEILSLKLRARRCVFSDSVRTMVLLLVEL